MTDAEIVELVDAVASKSAGIYAGLVTVIGGMQSQPGFDYPLVLKQLAAIQASIEQTARDSPETRAAFNETLE